MVSMVMLSQSAGMLCVGGTWRCTRGPTFLSGLTPTEIFFFFLFWQYAFHWLTVQNWNGSAVSVTKHRSIYCKNSPMQIKRNRRRQEQMSRFGLFFCLGRLCVSPSLSLSVMFPHSFRFFFKFNFFSSLLPVSNLFLHLCLFFTIECCDVIHASPARQIWKLYPVQSRKEKREWCSKNIKYGWRWKAQVSVDHLTGVSECVCVCEHVSEYVLLWPFHVRCVIGQWDLSYCPFSSLSIHVWAHLF